jgi:hypothetical protein
MVIPPYESSIRRADGAERIVEARATFITLEDSQIVLLSIIRDVPHGSNWKQNVINS